MMPALKTTLNIPSLITYPQDLNRDRPLATTKLHESRSRNIFPIPIRFFPETLCLAVSDITLIIQPIELTRSIMACLSRRRVLSVCFDILVVATRNAKSIRSLLNETPAFLLFASVAKLLYLCRPNALLPPELPECAATPGMSSFAA
jgi:hypothetical protein